MIGRFDGLELVNPRAERVKSVRALSKRSIRLRTGRFRLEGPQVVREAVEYHLRVMHSERRGPVQDLYFTRAFVERYPEIIDVAVQGGIGVRLASPEVLAAMSETPTDQGVVAISEHIEQELATVVDMKPRMVAVLSQIRDPGNAGTILRAADAAGADAVVFTDESVDVYNPKVVRSTAGSLFHLPVVLGVPLVDVVTLLHGADLLLLAADGSGEADLDFLLDQVARSTYLGMPVPAGVADLSAPTAWVFGNEAWGLRDHDRALCDHAVRIPIHGHAESLNLGTAAAICLYASARAQRSVHDSYS